MSSGRGKRRGKREYEKRNIRICRDMWSYEHGAERVIIIE